MEEIDANERFNDISDEEDLIMREVIRDDADLFYLHYYLSEVFLKGDNF